MMCCLGLRSPSYPLPSYIVCRQTVPVVALQVHGESVVDEGLLTGEAAPVPKRKGTIVFGGSLNAGTSPLTVRSLQGPAGHFCVETDALRWRAERKCSVATSG